MKSDAVVPRSVALMGSYVPRQCGIGTFTKDLRDSLLSDTDSLRTSVLAMDDTPEGYDYPPEVMFQLRASRAQDYQLAADLLNVSGVDVTLLQHEYGIYGGEAGDYVLEFARGLRMPLITTLHTVLAEPSIEQRTVIEELLSLSDRVVVMSERGRQLLGEVHGISRDKIALIHHGIPDVPFVDPAFYKDRYGLEGRTVLLTFGLMSPGKGIEHVIRALPRIAAAHPGVVYVVLGATHPHVLKREGNAYVNSLQRLAARLGVDKNVIFHNRYVTLQELCRYIGAADIYITPYLNEAQIVSGTLAYAMGMGKAVISTPYWYAREMLADGRGWLVPFSAPDELARTVVEVLDDPVQLNAARKRAYMMGRTMIWKEVAREYLALAGKTLAERETEPRPIFYYRPLKPYLGSLPEVDLTHMRTMTDDTGILQHAIDAIPDRNHGYCTDDNARALLVATSYYRQTRDDAILPLARTYLSFLHHAMNPDNGRFRNFMGYDRRWLEDAGSEDSHGRVIWALGHAVAHAPTGALLSFATRLFEQGVACIETLTAPRSLAFCIIGLHAYLERYGGSSLARRLRAVMADRLFGMFRKAASDNWVWCEDVVTYANARLPHALILSGQWMPHQEMLDMGLRSLDWLVREQLAPDGKVSIVGNDGWYVRGGVRARFDQQPIEVAALVEACTEAFKCTADPMWRDRALQFLGWFLGNNDTESMLYDPETGGCRDGLRPNGPNLNQGAESTLAWLAALLAAQWLDARAETPPGRGIPVTEDASQTEEAVS